MHFIVDDLSKQVFPLVGNDGNEIRASGGVIVSREAD